MSNRSKKLPCQNPLFLKWLEEWRDDAREKGLNSQWTYQKAINSLKKYPLPLRSGKDAIILESIGGMIAAKLDKALAEHIAAGGDIPCVANNTTGDDLSKDAKQKVQKKRPRENAAKDSNNTFSCLESGSEGKKSKRTKEYIPKQGSGPYALILTLYRESQSNLFKGYMTKDELQQKAEPLSEKSFTVADPGSHYTAWSSMSTLINKGLVSKNSNPAKYSLTESGKELGKKLQQQAGSISVTKKSDIRSFNLNDIPGKRHVSCDIEEAQPSTSYTASSSLTEHRSYGINETQQLKFWYVSSGGKLSSSKNDAAIEIDEIRGECMFLIKCLQKDLGCSSLTYRIDNTRPADKGFVYAYLSDKDAIEKSSPPCIEKETSLPSSSSTIIEPRLKGMGNFASNVIETVPFQQNFANRINSSQLNFQEDRHSENSGPTSDRMDIRANFIGEDMTPLFKMMPGTFEVLLCVDHGEVAAGSKANSKKMMMDQLKKSGVSMDVRKLQLGDFLWIAREKASHGGSRRELVLDFIAERKRMDDLAGSIIDGRFKEQKFRLRSCGLKHVIYLIESFGSMQHLVLPEANLRQAFVNSQVIDDLFVRKTENTYESAAYLARMTKLLKSFYEEKTLAAYPMDHLKKHKADESYKEIIGKQTQNLFTFSDFDQQTAKNKMLTVKEMFAKQLMQLKGVSSEKAAAIVELYPTPKSLALALQRCKDDDEKQNMLADVKFGRTKRKIGPMISKQIKILYESNVPLT